MAALLDSVDAELREALYALRDYGKTSNKTGRTRPSRKRIDALHACAQFRLRPEDRQRLADWRQQLAELDNVADLDGLLASEAEALSALRETAEVCPTGDAAPPVNWPSASVPKCTPGHGRQSF